jgi:hypothetical protein
MRGADAPLRFGASTIIPQLAPAITLPTKKRQKEKGKRQKSGRKQLNK